LTIGRTLPTRISVDTEDSEDAADAEDAEPLPPQQAADWTSPETTPPTSSAGGNPGYPAYLPSDDEANPNVPAGWRLDDLLQPAADSDPAASYDPAAPAAQARPAAPVAAAPKAAYRVTGEDLARRGVGFYTNLPAGAPGAAPPGGPDPNGGALTSSNSSFLGGVRASAPARQFAFDPQTGNTTGGPAPGMANDPTMTWGQPLAANSSLRSVTSDGDLATHSAAGSGNASDPSAAASALAQIPAGPMGAAREALLAAQQAAADSRTRTAATLQSLGVPLVDATGAPLDLDTAGIDALRAQVDATYNAEYAADAANDHAAFGLSSGYTPDAQALRDDITRRKAQAMAAIGEHLGTLGAVQQAANQYDDARAPMAAFTVQRLGEINAQRTAQGLPPVAIPLETQRLANRFAQGAGAADGTNGTNGTNGMNGMNGKDGTNGSGADGAAGGPASQNSSPTIPGLEDFANVVHTPQTGGDAAAQPPGATDASPGSADASDPQHSNTPALQSSTPSAAQQALLDAQAGKKAYGYDPATGIHFTQENPADGLRQAVADGLIDPQWAAAHQADFQAVQDKYQALVKSAGGAAQVKALMHGLGIGGAFALGSIPGAKIGALGAALIPGVGETGIAELIAGGLGGLATGTMAAWAAHKALDKLAEYSTAVKSLNDSAELHPYYDQAGQLVGSLLNAPKAISNVYNVARIAADEAGNIGAGVKLAARIVGGSAAVGAGFEATVRPVFDLAKNAVADQLGYAHDEFQPPTLKSMATNAALAMFVAGHNIEFKDYTGNEITDIFTRAQARQLAGVPLEASLTSEQAAAAAQAAGLKSDATAAFQQPLAPAELKVFNAIGNKMAEMKASGNDENARITDITARQAVVPDLLGGKKPLTTATSTEIQTVPGESPRAMLDEPPGISPAVPRAALEAPSSPSPAAPGDAPIRTASGSADPNTELAARRQELATMPSHTPPWQREVIAGRIRQLQASLTQNENSPISSPALSLSNGPAHPSGLIPGLPVESAANPPPPSTIIPGLPDHAPQAPALSPSNGSLSNGPALSLSKGWGAINPSHVGAPVETRDGRRGTLREAGRDAVAIQPRDGAPFGVPRSEARLSNNAGTPPERLTAQDSAAATVRPSPAETAPHPGAAASPAPFDELAAPNGAEGPPDPEPGASHAPFPSSGKSATPKDLLPAHEILPLLQPHIDEYHAKIVPMEKEIAQLRDRLEKGRETMPMDEHIALYKRINALDNERNAALDKIADESRPIVTLPPAHQGTLKITGDIPDSLKSAVNGGRRIVESYVHKDLLPRASFEELPPDTRAHHHGMDTSHLSPTGTSTAAAHEIVHGIEKQIGSLITKSRAFLTQRAVGKARVRLDQLYPDGSHEPDEYTFEDEWIAKGGSAYSGRDYSYNKRPEKVPYTELLTTGITRLHQNPALFAATDPEYFSFVLNTLRNF